MIEEGRKQGSKAVWIVTAQRRDLAAQVEALDGVPKSCVLGIFSAPENLLFASNELLAESDHSRESPRMLYATVVDFRPAGEASDEFGFCYNVSRGGLYVRTLAPPEEDAVWLEMRPPRTKKCVRLEGRVAWRRVFGPTAMATAPPGFRRGSRGLARGQPLTLARRLLLAGGSSGGQRAEPARGRGGARSECREAIARPRRLRARGTRPILRRPPSAFAGPRHFRPPRF